MATNNPTECGVCSEEYDEDARCPRILQCFHYLCSDCLSKLITSDAKKCPFCRQIFQANLTKDIMINNAIVDFMKYMSLKEPTPEALGQTKDARSKKMLDDFKKVIVEASDSLLIACQEAIEQIEESINDMTELKENCKQNNIKIQNDILPKLHNIIAENNLNVEKYEIEDNAYHALLCVIPETIKQLQDIKITLVSTSTFKETVIAINEAEELNCGISKMVESFKRGTKENKIIFQREKKELESKKEKIDNFLEILNSWSEEKVDVILPNAEALPPV